MGNPHFTDKSAYNLHQGYYFFACSLALVFCMPFAAIGQCLPMVHTVYYMRNLWKFGQLAFSRAHKEMVDAVEGSARPALDKQDSILV